MTASEAVRPQRRVGTFTLGAVLVAAGCGMLASLLWPRAPPGPGAPAPGGTAPPPPSRGWISFWEVPPWEACRIAPLWLYSFFDSFNLRRQIREGMAPEDEFLFGMTELDSRGLGDAPLHIALAHLAAAGDAGPHQMPAAPEQFA